MTAPRSIRIAYEDSDHDRFNCIGRCTAGPPGASQFMAFVTAANPRVPGWDFPYPHPDDHDWASKKLWFGVVHVFDDDGAHVGTVARSGGSDADGREAACERAVELTNQVLASLGELTYCDIEVQLFGLMIEGYYFGLRYEEPEEEDEDGFVWLWPNDITFHPPYDGTGGYST